MKIWRDGREKLGVQVRSSALSLDEFVNRVQYDSPNRVEGQAVFLSRNPDLVPQALLSNYRYNKVLHTKTVILNIQTKPVPRVENDEKIEIKKYINGFYVIIAYYGFMETPKVNNILYLANEQGVDLDPAKASYFIGREVLLTDKDKRLSGMSSRIFSFLSRNSFSATQYFDIPLDKVLILSEERRI